METAIVMPLFVFIVLGLLQLALMHQARLMTKYAAYKAVRAGAIHSAKMAVMEGAALGVLLPFMADGAKQAELTYHATSGGEFSSAWSKVKNNNQQTSGKRWVHVDICNPTTDVYKGQDFDEPNQFYGGGRATWKDQSATRLNVQVTFFYRMPIPFANGVLWWITHGQENAELIRVLRLGAKQAEVATPKNSQRHGESKSILDFKSDAEQGYYIMPIRASWGMRMHSNIFKDEGGFQLPDSNKCILAYE